MLQHGYYVEWKKADSKDYILNNSIYTKFPERGKTIETKQISGCLEVRVAVKTNYKQAWENFLGVRINLKLNCGDSYTTINSINIIDYTLNNWQNLWYMNHTQQIC